MSLHDAQLEENLVLPLRRAVEVWDALEEPKQSTRLMELREAVREALRKFDESERVETPYQGEQPLRGERLRLTKQGSSEKSHIDEANNYSADDSDDDN